MHIHNVWVILPKIFIVDSVKKKGICGYAYDFSVDYDSVHVDELLLGLLSFHVLLALKCVSLNNESCQISTVWKLSKYGQEKLSIWTIFTQCRLTLLDLRFNGPLYHLHVVTVRKDECESI